ncbi:CpsD/CapB family tyrosine-protein kinase [Paenibacillus radicis (ex Xue et al. 2023)]|uniref:non-specific protein-tyrosine kinase n=1 Tax=Paenibacillus radicis (ex Xue et al. 2023) TaxID=2972489 RepID=A0ABT1YRW4_9BACL|nr:CpsD/CapB family tyrosine-protein kinase [Paenibacillus radicis (ex Xue et al. 2023)]MCR8635918.1 CpsD/CapB family tyrosine-protein kinase [Paenibacillus radicis (ex Xue et al. 2023)]
MSLLSNVLVIETDPNSAVAESYRSLRTSIRHKRLGKPGKGITLMIASPKAQEGKTTTVSNLAVTFSQDGQKVIVIDCNLRQPTLHAVYGMPNEDGLAHDGLTQYLKSDSTQGITSKAVLPNLHLITAGGQPPNPSELLGSPRMAELLDQLKQQYDVVLLDSPSILDFTDAGLLAEYSDGIILVAKYGRTKREWAKQAKERLEQSGARLLGMIINK